MAVLCWMAVTLALLLSAGNSLPAVDQNQLAGIVDEILNRFRPSYMIGRNRISPMFSLAVSIPYNSATKKYDMNQVPDDGPTVRNAILNCDVYTSTRVVAATLLRWPNVLDQCPNAHVPWPRVVNKCGEQPMTWAALGMMMRDSKSTQQCRNAVRRGTADHAEYRTLQYFNTLVNNHNRNDLLMFYVFASPCASRCTNAGDTRNILRLINPIRNWNNYAFVFSKVFKPREGDPIPEEALQEALMQLGTYQGTLGPIGLDNIFRCDGRPGQKHCTSCSTGGQVTRECFSDEPQPGPSHSG